MTIEISASTVAWYGAIVATASAALGAYNILRDRPKLIIRIKPNMRFYPPQSPNEDKDFVIITVANAGRRPITVTHVWMEKGRRVPKKLLIKESIVNGPRELTEGRSVDFTSYQDPLDSSWKYVVVSDSTGKLYRRKVPRSARLAFGKATAVENAGE